jgi:hypothetical protein
LKEKIPSITNVTPPILELFGVMWKEKRLAGESNLLDLLSSRLHLIASRTPPYTTESSYLALCARQSRDAKAAFSRGRADTLGRHGLRILWRDLETCLEFWGNVTASNI